MNTVRLCELAEINPPSAAFDRLADDESVSFLPMEGVWPDALEMTERPKAEVGLGYTRFQENDLLVPKISPTFSHGRSSIAHGLIGGVGAGTTELHVLRARPGVETRWLYYVTKAAPFLQEGESTLYGVAGQKRIDLGWLRSYRVPALPSGEQRRIVEFLDTETARIDSLIAEQETQRRLLGDRFRLVMREAITGRLGLKELTANVGPHWLGPTPESWRTYKVGQCFRTGSGTTPDSSHGEYYEGPIPWVNTAELRESVIMSTAKTVSIDALRDYSTLIVYEPGSVVIAMYGATIGRLGILGIRATVNQACCVLHGETDIRTQFVYYWFMAYRPEIAYQGQGGGQPNINQELIRQLRIPAPGLAEQDEIIRFLDDERDRTRLLDDECSRQIALLREHRQALITATVTGGWDALGKEV